MKAIENLRKLLDEMPVITEISEDLPYKYSVIIKQKINDLNALIEAAHSTEMKRIKNINSDEENHVLENFCGEIIKTETFNSKENEKQEPSFLDMMADRYAKSKKKLN